jgi:hypothetical protein
MSGYRCNEEPTSLNDQPRTGVRFVVHTRRESTRRSFKPSEVFRPYYRLVKKARYAVPPAEARSSVADLFTAIPINPNDKSKAVEGSGTVVQTAKV